MVTLCDMWIYSLFVFRFNLDCVVDTLILIFILITSFPFMSYVGRALGFGSQHQTYLMTHKGSNSLLCISKSLHGGLLRNALTFLSWYRRSKNTPRWNSIVQNFLYNSFLKKWLRREGRELSVGHHICLLVSSVTHDLHKQNGHSSVMLFCSILNVHSNSSVSCMSSISSISQLFSWNNKKKNPQLSTHYLHLVQLLSYRHLPPSFAVSKNLEGISDINYYSVLGDTKVLLFCVTSY